MTIDELARVCGVSSRNIRAYQTQGLLPPPHRRGRAGEYDESHARRLDAIRRLRGLGFSLPGIRVLFEWQASGRTLDELVGRPAERVTDADPPAHGAHGHGSPPRRGDDREWVDWLEAWPPQADAMDGLALLPGPVASRLPGHTN